jgi:hypothetical protein
MTDSNEPKIHSSSQSWAAPIVSIIVLLTFQGVMLLALTRSLPAGSETLLNMMLGSLAAMTTSVVSYWLGSSAGSERKTDMLYRSTPAGTAPGTTTTTTAAPDPQP